MKFYTLQIAQKTQETDDTVSLLLDIPTEHREAFGFQAGQYLTLRTEIDGQDVRRSYSLCSAPSDQQWRVGIKKVEGGLFSTFANDTLQEGDTLQVAPPAGSFVVKDSLRRSAHSVAFAAGSGITPVLSIIRETLNTDPEAQFDLFYGNKKSESIIFREELEALKNQFMGRFQLHYILSRERQLSDWFYGRLDAQKCLHYAGRLFDPAEIDQFFLCGPHAMIENLKEALLELKVEPERIQFELFTSPLGPLSSSQASAKRKPGEKLADLRVTLDGLTIDLAMMSEHDSVLDAALAEGVDLPYACKGGVCSTCKAKITQGQVQMQTNYALEPDEVEAGYVLTCQAQPALENQETIEVNFDL